jgi:16S rRNA (cytosine967-C5)-methyltransferase
MKLHRPLVEAVVEALTDIFQNHKYADKVIERLLRSNPKWGSRDRAFIAETTYECVRWLRLLATIAGKNWENSSQNSKNTEGGYLGFSRADFLEIVGVYWTLKAGESIDFAEFKHLHADNLTIRKADWQHDRRVRESIPDWMDAVGEQELGSEKWTAVVQAMNQTADVVLRCNNLKVNVLDLQKQLAAVGWETEKHPLSNSALILKKRGNIFQTQLFKDGFFEVQDAGSQLIAPFLQVEAGMRVVDACAGAGGKTLHLATLMENRGKIIALDTEGWKLEELRKRARRNGIHIVETRPIESTKTIKRLAESADRLLLDVPCSGLGVLRRNPDAKWKLQATFIDTIRKTQQEILTNYSKMLRVGGKMVYATCSVLPSENAEQVKQFLEKNPNFKWLDEKTVSPDVAQTDGFYMALLERI